MMQEDYVSFEVAKLLKEKGFDVPIHTFYNLKNIYLLKIDPCLINRNAGIHVSAPTFQMAMKWLRYTHKIFIEVGFNRFYGTYNVHIFNMIEQEKDPFKLPERFDSYEEACNEAIRYCLINLI